MHIRQSTRAHVITITCENDIFVKSSLMALSIHLLNAKFNLKTGYDFFQSLRSFYCLCMLIYCVHLYMHG